MTPTQVVRTYEQDPQIGDVIELRATVVQIHPDGSVMLDVVDAAGRSVALFDMPAGLGFIVYRVPDPLPPPTREEMLGDG